MAYQCRVLLLLALLRGVFPTISNVTVDDEYGDEVTGAKPSYSPSEGWSQGANCTGCLAKPDPSQAFSGTWHDGTATPGDPEGRVVNYTFNGACGLLHLTNRCTNQKLQALPCMHTVFWQTQYHSQTPLQISLLLSILMS
jgi:hypothetical protein